MTQAQTEDGNIHLYTPSRVHHFSRLVVTLLVIGLLLIPMVILYNLSGDLAKFLTIVISTFAFAVMLTIGTNARKAEIFTATAA
jgi:hypothetical protein